MLPQERGDRVGALDTEGGAAQRALLRDGELRVDAHDARRGLSEGAAGRRAHSAPGERAAERGLAAHRVGLHAPLGLRRVGRDLGELRAHGARFGRRVLVGRAHEIPVRRDPELEAGEDPSRHRDEPLGRPPDVDHPDEGLPEPRDAADHPHRRGTLRARVRGRRLVPHLHDRDPPLRALRSLRAALRAPAHARRARGWPRTRSSVPASISPRGPFPAVRAEPHPARSRDGGGLLLRDRRRRVVQGAPRVHGPRVPRRVRRVRDEQEARGADAEDRPVRDRRRRLPRCVRRRGSLRSPRGAAAPPAARPADVPAPGGHGPARPLARARAIVSSRPDRMSSSSTRSATAWSSRAWSCASAEGRRSASSSSARRSRAARGESAGAPGKRSRGSPKRSETGTGGSAPGVRGRPGAPLSAHAPRALNGARANPSRATRFGSLPEEATERDRRRSPTWNDGRARRRGSRARGARARAARARGARR